MNTYLKYSGMHEALDASESEYYWTALTTMLEYAEIADSLHGETEELFSTLPAEVMSNPESEKAFQALQAKLQIV